MTHTCNVFVHSDLQWRRQDLVSGGTQKLLGVYMRQQLTYSRCQILYKSNKVHLNKLNCCKSRGHVPQCTITCDANGDLDLRHFDPKIDGFPELVVIHFYVKFNNPSCIGF